jgi:hypothetical protein
MISGVPAALRKVIEKGARTGDVHRCGQLQHVVQFSLSNMKVHRAQRAGATG